MAKREGLSSKAYDRQFPDIDDVDHMAHVVRERALEEREWSVKGLLRSLAHIAHHEDDAIDDIVIDPEFVDELAESKKPSDRKIIEKASTELREWLDGSDSGKKQRARYALVRFDGPTSDLVESGLLGPPASQLAVLQALADPL